MGYDILKLMKEILFSFLGVNVYSFGIFICVSFLLGFWLVTKLAKNEDVDTYFIFDLSLATFLIALIISKLSFMVLYYSQLSTLPFLKAFLSSGFVLYPGLSAGLVTWFLIIRTKNLDLKRWSDWGILTLFFSLSFSKIGEFLTSSVYGKVSNLPWAISNQHPVAIYELLLYLGIGILFLRFKNQISKGNVFIYGVLAIAIVNFLMGFLKISLLNYSSLSYSQWFSLAIIIIYALFYVLPLVNKFSFKEKK